LNEVRARIDCAPMAFAEVIEDGNFVPLVQQQLDANAPDVASGANNENFHAPKFRRR